MGGAATDITRIQATYHDQSTKNHAPTPGIWSYESNTVGVGSTCPQKQISDIPGTSICIRLGGTSIPDLLDLIGMREQMPAWLQSGPNHQNLGLGALYPRPRAMQ